MNIENYKKLSEKTLSDNYHLSESESQDQFVDIIYDVLRSSNLLDQMKKIIFYGKPNNIKKEIYKNVSDYNTFKCDDQKNQRVLHAAIGMVTESVEILEQVFISIKNNEEIDIINIEEELGDSDWYKAILLREYGFDEGDLRHKNIDKLAARYGEKFSGHKALNRDLKTEREILEKK